MYWGASAWEEWCVRVASLVMKGELQTFKAEQLEDARESVESKAVADGLFLRPAGDAVVIRDFKK
jgi:hypothetical protein